jgi:hypothetical protein
MAATGEDSRSFVKSGLETCGAVTGFERVALGATADGFHQE